MSDYMFMLESHLNGDHNRVVTVVTSLANEANVNLYLAGGAVRDMLGGFAIRDLDFTLETNVPEVSPKKWWSNWAGRSGTRTPTIASPKSGYPAG